VQLTDDRANWPFAPTTVEGGTLLWEVTNITDAGFTVTMTGAPEGARVAFQLDDGEFSSGEDEDDVVKDGTVTHTFMGTAPATTYALHVKALGDANHNESDTVFLQNVTTAQPTPNIAELPPTATMFDSTRATVHAMSLSPVLTLHTNTYVDAKAGGDGTATPILPTGIVMTAPDWTQVNIAGDDVITSRVGYERNYDSAQYSLPTTAQLVSTSHVFKGWHTRDMTTGGNAGVEDGAVDADGYVIATPDDSAERLDHDYNAVWVVRPTITGVTGTGGAAVLSPPQVGTPALGLNPGAPVRLTVTFRASGAAQELLTLSGIQIAGQSATNAATLYSSTDFDESHKVDSLTLNWADASGSDAGWTHAYVKTVSADDDTTVVYYDITLRTMRLVALNSVAPTDGVSDVKTTTALTLSFSKAVQGLAGRIAVAPADGDGGVAEISGPPTTTDEGVTWTVPVTVTKGGDITVTINDTDWTGYDILAAAATKQVTVHRDKTVPTATVNYKNRGFTEFLNWATFGRFFKNTVDVNINFADENGDGVVTAGWYQSDTVIEDEGRFKSILWNGATVADGAATATFTQEANSAKYLYVHALDAAGNSAVYHDGVVVYTDSTIVEDSNTVNFTRMSNVDGFVLVNRNGNSVLSVTDETGVGDDEEGMSLVLDDDFYYGAISISLKNLWLSQLSAGSGDAGATYRLRVDFKPLDLNYFDDTVEGGDAINERPAPAYIYVNVSKYEATNAALSISEASGQPYSPTGRTLTFTVPKPTGSYTDTAATGNVSFYATLEGNGRLLGTKALAVNGEGNAVAILTDVALDAGTYDSIRAVYAGDTNYASISDSITGYVITKVNQSAPVISGAGIKDGVLDVVREDTPLTFTATGGKGTGDYVWASSNETVATVAGDGENNTTGTITLKTKGDTIITLKREGDTNYWPYPNPITEPATTQVILTIAEETTLPIPGGDGMIVAPAANVVFDGLTLEWAKASDPFPTGSDDQLTYKVYASTSDNITTAADCLANGGTPLNGGGTTNIDGYNVENLEPDTVYWFNVVVSDAADNRAAYTPVRVVTPRTTGFTLEQFGGADGTLETTGIVVSFTYSVQGFVEAVAGDEAHPSVLTLPEGIVLNGTVMYSDSAEKWLIPVSFEGFIGENNSTQTMTIASWTTADGHHYDMSNGPQPNENGYLTGGFTVYKPVPFTTPDIEIDYVEELLTGFESGHTYWFNGADYLGGNGITIIDGSIAIDPYWFGDSHDSKVLAIVHKGWPTVDFGVTYVDSERQLLYVPARPATPEVSTTQPNGSVGTGSVAITTPYPAETTWEYRALDVDATPREWTTLGGGASGTPPPTEGDDGGGASFDADSLTLAGLAPGRYELRVAAVATVDEVSGSFASLPIDFYIYGFNEYRFEDQLEGYNFFWLSAEGRSLAPMPVKADDAREIASVEFYDDPADDTDGNPTGNASSWFTLSDSGDGYTVQPVSGLTSEPIDNDGPDDPTNASFTYVATLKIYYEPISQPHLAPPPSYQKVRFTVHPNAQFVAGAGGAQASSVDDPTGATDRLTLRFVYPVVLDLDDIVISGAATKTQFVSGFVSVSEDYKTYVLNVTPAKYWDGGNPERSYRTGDGIDVSVTLDDAHQFQKTAPEPDITTIKPDARPTVTIPRAIVSAKVLDAPSGYSSLAVQFTLDHALFGIAPTRAGSEPFTDGLLLSDIKLTAGDGGSDVTGIVKRALVRVDADRDPDDERNYYTYRVEFSAETGGAVKLGIPNYSVADFECDVPVSVIPGENDQPDPAHTFAGVTYALGDTQGTGVIRNYPYSFDGYQVLPTLDVTGGYVAPELALRLDRENANTSVAAVYLDGDYAHPLQYTWHVSGGGELEHYYLDDVDKGALANQAVLTLHEDWTRTTGVHTIEVVIVDVQSGERRLLSVSVFVTNITETHKVTVRGDMAAGASAAFGTVTGIPSGTSDDAFAVGATLTITAPPAAPGWKFDYWMVATEGVEPQRLPSPNPTTYAMLTVPLTFTAHYTDGVAPTVTITPETGSWVGIWGTITITATDDDVRKAIEGNALGAGLGEVASIEYSIDGGPTQTAEFGEDGPYSVNIRLDRYDDGLHTIRYRATDAAGNVGEVFDDAINKDSENPTATISVRGSSFTGNAAEGSDGVFTRFYKGDVEFSITGNDDGGDAASGVVSVEYLKVSEPFEYDGEAFNSSGWLPVVDDMLTISEDDAFFLYVHVIDGAGNERIVSTEGIVRYTDSVQTDDEIEFTCLGTADVVAATAFNGNTVANITYKLGNKDSNNTPMSLDHKAYRVNYGGTTPNITFSHGWLGQLAAFEYTIEVFYRPPYLPYIPGEGFFDLNDPPASTTIDLVVKKATPTVTLNATGTTFGENNVTLTATVSGVEGARYVLGAVTFYDGDQQLGEPFEVNPDNGGMANNIVTLNASEHNLRVEYSGNEYYEEGSDSKPDYVVGKADQTTPVTFAGEGIVAGDTGYVLTKYYGDVDVVLTASGGDGDGGYVWTSDKPSIVSVNGAAVTDTDVAGKTATLHINKVGENVTITLKRLASDNYNESDEVTFTVNVARRPVWISDVAVAPTKVYDALKDAEITGTQQLENVAPEGAKVSLLTTGATATYADENVADGIVVDFSGYALEGDDAGSFVLSQPASTTANITPAPVTAQGVGAADKTYDGTTAVLEVTGVADAKLTGVYLSDADDVSLLASAGTGTFAAKEAGERQVTFSGFALDGNRAFNYYLSAEPASVTATINQKLVTVGGIGAFSKEYDGGPGTDSDLNEKWLFGVLGSGDAIDDTNDVKLDWTNASARFIDSEPDAGDAADVGSDKTVTFSGFSLKGDRAGNYVLQQPGNVTSVIMPKNLTIVGVTSSDKTYDGNTTALLDTSKAELDGVVTSDIGKVEIRLADDVAATFDSPEAGARTVSFTGFSLTGTEDGDRSFNYTLNKQPEPRTYTIFTASQEPPVISHDDITTGEFGPQLVKTYGDESVTLSASSAVGTGTGDYVWTIEGEFGIVEVTSADFHNAKVTLSFGIAGTTKISVLREGDADHEPSEKAYLWVTVEKRRVSITGVSTKDKIYNGKDDAPLVFAESVFLENVTEADNSAGESTLKLERTGATARFVDSAPAAGDAADAGEGKTVKFTGFTLSGTHADNYILNQPADATATIYKVTPTWAVEPSVSDITFGQILGDAVLGGGTATGVAGSGAGELAGEFGWASGVSLVALPGDADVGGLAADGYSYDVVFVPTDTTNYEVLTDTVTVMVSPALSFMAGGIDATPTGTTLFSSSTGHGDVLATSVITGDVAFTYAGMQTDVPGGGTWHWDADGNGVYDPSADEALAEALSFSDVGFYQRSAVFIPTDPRIAHLVSEASFAVYSPKTIIEAAPEVGTVVWGQTLGDVAIIGTGTVMASRAEGGEGGGDGEPEDISDAGRWSWKNPETPVVTLGSTQQATLVFTPEVEVDWSDDEPTGYLSAEVPVTLTVIPAVPTLSLEGVLPPLPFGKPLSELDLSLAGYEFAGTASLGDAVLFGTLAFDEPDLVPGAVGFETDEEGNSARDDGVFVVHATFVPAAMYAGGYASVPVVIRVRVVASVETSDELAEVVGEGGEGGGSQLAGKLSAENYTADDFALYEDAFEAAREALNASDEPGLLVVTEAEAARLLAELKDALNALVHDHPIISNSAAGAPITHKGVALRVEIKGDFASVSHVLLNGREFVLAPTGDPDVITLVMDGVVAGTLTRGSAVVTLDAGFVDGLPNDSHRVEVRFADPHAQGVGGDDFVVERAVEASGSGGGAEAGSGGGVGSGGGAGGGGAGAVVPDPAGDGDKPGDDALDSGGTGGGGTAAGPGDDDITTAGTWTLTSFMVPFVLCLVALIALAVLLWFIIGRRRKKGEEEANAV
jgi:hypothetical protein